VYFLFPVRNHIIFLNQIPLLYFRANRVNIQTMRVYSDEIYNILFIFTIISAVLLPLALPNELFLDGNPLLGLFCLSFYFYALYHAPSFKFASFLGLIFGCYSTVIANYWLVNFGEFSVWTLGGTTVGYMLYNALLAPIIYGFAKIKPRYRAFLIAAVWALYEYLKSSGFLGYPWGLIAYPVHTISPLIQFVDITGLWGLSWFMAFINAVGAEIVSQFFTPQPKNQTILRLRSRPLTPWPSYTLTLAALLVISLAYGTVRLILPINIEKKFEILLIQQNKDPWERGMSTTSISAARNLTRQGINQSLKKNNKRPDLIAWNETALRYVGQADLDFFKSTGTYNLIGVPLTISTDPFQAYNASLLLSPDAVPLCFYAKQHPVPFAESIPFWEIPLVRVFFREVIGISSFWVLGSEYTVYDLPLDRVSQIRFGTPICFEDVFPDLCRNFFLKGADVIINMSNDSWSKTNSALTQHIAAAKFRAVENRRTLIRATNAGLTCVVGAKGEILASIPIFRQDYLLTEVPVYKENDYTPYTLLGDYFAFALALILLFILVENSFRFSLLNFLMRMGKRPKLKR
jgi:apolipoprotein N-acyltransferase